MCIRDRDALGQQSLDVDDIAVLKRVQGTQVDDLQRGCENVVEAALGQTACQRNLARCV